MTLEQLISDSAPLVALEEKTLLAIIAKSVSGYTPAPPVYPREVYSGPDDDPNGILTPDDPTKPATYYKAQATPIKLWLWNVTDQNWFPIVT